MSKKDIMTREIRSIFIKSERDAIENDMSEIACLSHAIMRICRGATLFVVIITPILNIVQFEQRSLAGFLTGLIYVLSMVFVLTPLLYLLIAAVALRNH